MSNDQILSKLRHRIDAIDSDLLELISERAGIANEIAETKISQSGDSIFYCPEREAQVLSKLIKNNPGPLSGKAVACLFRELMSACLALQQPLEIAYLGPEGTFTQTAALKHFGHSVQMIPMNGIDQVFREVASATCKYGVVPVENSTEGIVKHTLDMLIDSNLMICGEVELHIHHHLLSNEDSSSDIQQVFSHEQSLAQCRGWLNKHLSQAECVSVISNAEAARMASKKKNAAAVAGESAAEFYDLPLLARNIEDEDNNMTRFLVLGKQSTLPSGKDKTSLLFTTPNKVGALKEMLACFSDHGVSMTRIESRPSRQDMWQYIFFVDIEGHSNDPLVAAALDGLHASASMVKLLGSYPRAVF